MAVIIAFDFGLKRTGVAIGNTLTGSASPECTLHSKNNQPDWDRISDLFKEWQPAKIVVGMPTELDGSESPLTKDVQRFCNQIQGRYTIEVEQENEQFTSIEAGRRLKQLRQSGRKKKITKDEVDKIAATIILENWMQKNAFS